MNIRLPDITDVFYAGGSVRFKGCTGKYEDITVRSAVGASFIPFIQADKTPLRYMRMRWIFRGSEARAERVKVLGDEWERGYGRMEWKGIQAERCMPWVCMVSNGSDADDDVSGRFTECFGVKVRPKALCFWQYDPRGVTLWADIRCGGEGVILSGRELDVCEVLFGEYRDTTAFRGAHAFYKTLCDDMLVPAEKVYGSNDWYYAYGNTSHEEILTDTRIVSDMCSGNANRPYMVIDNGWQEQYYCGPWDKSNSRFPDMRRLADEMKALNTKPGLWVRYLDDTLSAIPGVTEEMRLSRDRNILDPSHPEVLRLIAFWTDNIVNNWGYRLIKHDFSTFDIFGFWGMSRVDTLTDDGWTFYDRGRTSAEIVTGFYRTIKQAAGQDCVIIGCNVIGHLTAGLAELNRTGDDTSGLEWERTRKNGVNTVAFHMLHDKTLYAADGDCVGITENVDWSFNREWLRLLSVSGTPLFISCKPGVPDEEMTRDIREAYRVNSVQTDVLEPVDWMETTCPSVWRLNGETIKFNWYPDEGTGAFRG